MSKKHLLSFLLFAIATTCGYCVNLDSLKSSLPTKKGEQLVNAYLEVSELSANKFGQIDSLIYYATIGYKKAIAINYLKGAFRALLAIGGGYSKKNDLETSNRIFNKLALQKDKIGDPQIIGDLYFKLGHNSYLMNDYAKSLDQYMEAVKSFSSINDADGLALTYSRIAAIFSTQKQYEQCLEYIYKSFEQVPHLKNNYSEVSIYSTASGLFVQIGTKKKNYLDSSIYYGEKALLLAIKNEYYSKGAQLCNSMSQAYTHKGNPDKSLEYLKTATRFNAYLFPGEGIITYMNLGDHYYYDKQYSLAIKYLDSVYIYLESADDIYYNMIAAERVYAYNKDAGNLSLAIAGLELFKTLEDSIYTRDINENINTIKEKYESELKDTQIQSLHQEKELDDLKIIILGGSVAFAGLAILLIIIFYRQRVISQRQKIFEVEQRLNRSRMNPHFFFNALTSIQTLSMNDNKSKEVPFYISKFSKIMRAALESTYTELSSIEEELEFLKQYMDVQRFYLDNKFNYSIVVANNLQTSEYFLPSMILQPFIENSIEHGFKTLTSQGSIQITISKTEKELSISIIDNGIGIQENENNKSYQSRATQIIKDRLFLLNKKYKSTANYSLHQPIDSVGMQVNINLPIINEK